MKRWMAWGLALIATVLLAWAFLGPSRLTGPPAPARVGILHPGKVDVPTVAGLKAGLAELGYVEGENVEFVYQGPAGHGERLLAAARALVDSQVDVIFVASTPATQAVLQATRGSDLPVVFAPVNDPIGAGVVADLRQPGANITGVRPPSSDGRRVQWFPEIVPGIQRILVPYNPGDRSSQHSLDQAREGARTRGLVVRPVAIRTDRELLTLIEGLPEDIEGIFLPRDALISGRTGEFAAAAIRRRLPLSAPGRTQTRAGALFGYGFVREEMGRHAAKLVDRVLKGAPPGELPVETSSASLFLNLKTAQAIGVDIPDQILRQAREIVR